MCRIMYLLVYIFGYDLTVQYYIDNKFWQGANCNTSSVEIDTVYLQNFYKQLTLC